MIAEPPSSAGVPHSKLTVPAVPVTEPLGGASGSPAGTTEFELVDDDVVPAVFEAVAVKV